MSSDARELLGGSTRESHASSDDAPAHDAVREVGKLTRAEVVRPAPRYPGKRTRLEDDPQAMSPASALRYAQWSLQAQAQAQAQAIDRKAHTTEVDAGALASAFGFLERSRTGEPLPRPLQQRLARELGADLTNLRVHTDPAAASAALLLGARAVTVGDDIYFAAGAYEPATTAGVELIAHEAAHVAHNQRAGRAASAGLSRPDDSHERDADAFARDFVAGDAASSRAGEGLPAALNTELAGALGVATSDVRVHSDARADEAARSLGARAFTSGKDIYFADGEYQPGSAAGRRLIAHEVAHTAQSDGSAPGATAGAAQVSSPGDAHERSADAFAEAFTTGAAVASVGRAPAGMLHRQDKSHDEQLADIQGHEMSVLLTKIAGLPGDVRTDYAAAGKVGGPRLQAAMRAVNEPSDWKTYITKYSNVAGHLPKDQVDILMTKLGGPDKDFRYYKDIGNFDGTVDGGAHLVTLIWRVKFVSAKNPADDQFDEHGQEELKNIAEDSKQKIESIWSGKGTLKCAADSVPPFTTKVEVQIVTTGQHSTITIKTGAQTGMDPKTKDRDGTWDPGVVNNQKNKTVTYDKDGKAEVGPDVEQSAAAHEFGHAIGLHHVDDVQEAEDQLRNDGKGGKRLSAAERKRLQDIIADHRKMQDNIYKDSVKKTGSGDYHGAGASAEYGSTAEEQRNIMGKGNEVKKIEGPDGFDPFVPFQKIAEKWGEEFLKAPNLNKWTSSNG